MATGESSRAPASALATTTLSARSPSLNLRTSSAVTGARRSRNDIRGCGWRCSSVIGLLWRVLFVQNLGGQSDAVGTDVDVGRRSGHSAGPDPATKQAQQPLVGPHQHKGYSSCTPLPALSFRPEARCDRRRDAASVGRIAHECSNEVAGHIYGHAIDYSDVDRPSEGRQGAWSSSSLA